MEGKNAAQFLRQPVLLKKCGRNISEHSKVQCMCEAFDWRGSVSGDTCDDTNVAISAKNCRFFFQFQKQTSFQRSKNT